MSARRQALVIDDDADIRELLSTLLETAGFNVDTMHDGIEAVRLPKPYDVILLDMNMPVFDGERLAGYWVMTEPEILRRVIVLSGYRHYTEGRQLPGIYASVAKPFDYQKLLKVVEECARQP